MCFIFQVFSLLFIDLTCWFIFNFIIYCSYLEAEGLEKTFKFKQKDIADVVDVASARKVSFLIIISEHCTVDKTCVHLQLYAIKNFMTVLVKWCLWQ